jgi:hypothetical protein
MNSQWLRCFLLRKAIQRRSESLIGQWTRGGQLFTPQINLALFAASFLIFGGLAAASIRLTSEPKNDDELDFYLDCDSFLRRKKTGLAVDCTEVWLFHSSSNSLAHLWYF